MPLLSPKQGQQFCKVSLFCFLPSSRFTFTILIVTVGRGTWIIRPCIAQAMPDSPDLPRASSSSGRAAARNLSCGTATWIYILNRQAPYLYFFTIYLHSFNHKVNPNRGSLPWWEKALEEDKSLIKLICTTRQKSHQVPILTLFHLQNYSSPITFPWHCHHI